MTSLLITSQIRFEVLKRTGKTVMGTFFALHLLYSYSTVNMQCNLDCYQENTFNFEIFIKGGGHHFWVEYSLKFNMLYVLILEILTNCFQILTTLAVLFLKK